MNRILRQTFSLSLIACLVMLFACQGKISEKADRLAEGSWKGEILTQGKSIPFQIEFGKEQDQYKAFLINGKEKLFAGEIGFDQDSLLIPLHVFNADIKLKANDGNSLSGLIRKYGGAAKYELPIKLSYPFEKRFDSEIQQNPSDISGKWQVLFKKANNDTVASLGIFKQKNASVEGTFLTKTGDYRYLEGQISEGNRLELSAFDGEHIYLFEAEIAGDTIRNGAFWSGKAGYRSWTAVRNDAFSLPNPDSLTFLKKGFKTVSFQLPSTAGDTIIFPGKGYQGKVTIIQILGSWCPNCMDETRLLASIYDEYHTKGLEIIGLAFEQKPDPAVAIPLINRFKNLLSVEYPVLLAGRASTKAVMETLPMLDQVMAFPTTIIIDRQGRVRKIHTGFSGPGTGEIYTTYVAELRLFLKKLLRENE